MVKMKLLLRSHRMLDEVTEIRLDLRFDGLVPYPSFKSDASIITKHQMIEFHQVSSHTPSTAIKSDSPRTIILNFPA